MRVSEPSAPFHGAAHPVVEANGLQARRRYLRGRTGLRLAQRARGVADEHRAGGGIVEQAPGEERVEDVLRGRVAREGEILDALLGVVEGIGREAPERVVHGIGHGGLGEAEHQHGEEGCEEAPEEGHRDRSLMVTRRRRPRGPPPCERDSGGL
jgi:hypothetical protein